MFFTILRFSLSLPCTNQHVSLVVVEMAPKKVLADLKAREAELATRFTEKRKRAEDPTARGGKLPEAEERAPGSTHHQDC